MVRLALWEDALGHRAGGDSRELGWWRADQGKPGASSRHEGAVSSARAGVVGMVVQGTGLGRQIHVWGCRMREGWGWGEKEPTP